MTITAPVHADVLPVGPSIDDPDNFDAEADAFVAAQRPFGTQMNALSDNVYANALAVKDLADSAAASAGAASTSAGQANASKSAAVQAAQDAATSAQAAAGSATAAAISSTGTTASSTSSVVMGNGTKTFTVPDGKQFPVAMPISATSQGLPANKMFGTVASYIGTTLTITVTTTEGSGTYTDWTLAPGGARGPGGGTAGGQLTGSLDELKGAAPASSATPDIWGAGGNYVPITQTAAITGLPNAPQPGATRTLKAESSFPITSSANFYVHGGSTVINVGDELDIVADTVSKFLVTIRRNEGNAPVTFHNVNILRASQVYVAQYTGPHKVTLVAGSGSGGVAADQTGLRAAAASGSSTGGIVIKTWNAQLGESYTLSIGAPGAGVTVTAATSFASSAGNDAGACSFAGGSINLVAGGGKKGNAALATSGNAVAAGAVGGSASGGDVNIQGSPSGTATSSGTAAAATGGAAAPYKGFAVASGNATATGTLCAASGGAGVGGKSGDVSATTTNSASSGGGYIGASPNATNLVNVNSGAGVSLPTEFFLTMVPLALGDAGSNAVTGNLTSATTAKGAGTGANVSTSSSSTSGTATMMGGTGAAAAVSGAATVVTGASLNAGGSGGAACTNPSGGGTSTATSGNGGAAFAILETL